MDAELHDYEQDDKEHSRRLSINADEIHFFRIYEVIFLNKS